MNAKSSVGETALDWANKFGSTDVIAVLNVSRSARALPYNAPQLKRPGERNGGSSVENEHRDIERGAPGSSNRADAWAAIISP